MRTNVVPLAEYRRRRRPSARAPFAWRRFTRFALGALIFAKVLMTILGTALVHTWMSK